MSISGFFGLIADAEAMAIFAKPPASARAPAQKICGASAGAGAGREHDEVDTKKVVLWFVLEFSRGIDEFAH